MPVSPDFSDSSGSVFDGWEHALMRRMAGTMIPRSDVHGVPGADDLVIFERIRRRVSEDSEVLRAGWDSERPDEPADRPSTTPASLDAVIGRLMESSTHRCRRCVALFGAAVIQCYYTDARVLAAMNREAVPPFPNGNRLEQGDWSLLDAVRRRPPMYREC